MILIRSGQFGKKHHSESKARFMPIISLTGILAQSHSDRVSDYLVFCNSFFFGKQKK